MAQNIKYYGGYMRHQYLFMILQVDFQKRYKIMFGCIVWENMYSSGF